MDKSSNKMSSPATLGDECSPWQGSAGEEDLVHEESMLKRKLAILEEFMEIGEIPPVGMPFSCRGMKWIGQIKRHGFSTASLALFV